MSTGQRWAVLLMTMVCCLVFGYVCGDAVRTRIEHQKQYIGNTCFIIKQG